MPIDREIISRAQQGDKEAFEALYKSSAAFVYNVAFRILESREDAREVLQDVFVLVFRKLKSFGFRSSFETWVYRVCVNQALNFIKKKERLKMNTFEYDDSRAQEPVVAAQAESNMIRQDRKDTADRLLATLAPDQRACVVLRDMQGLSYQEISRTLGININTVRSRLKRARERLLETGKKAGYERL